ncbi:DNA polymerase IV [Cryptosporangium phraense]|uniref:DNA polymerase IV n=1 Tax=Cryptosporangium phraense TaxID=2593070 RepID=A0A545AK60_9ACTN|nr:DNA polymerase IV [Cryptosporangium phraense]TQS41712.1 DNA polymerase IV [Cryptosporangium phraense]
MGRSQSLPRSGPGGELGDDTGCTILHVDMDAFFVSVEVRRDPSLRGKPVVVGGTGPRGVVSSASYEARAFGVRSAMPTSRARRLCPQAIYIQPEHGAYGEVSAAVMQIFRDVTPLVEPLSLDEAFLDVAGARRLLGSPAEIGRLIRRRVAEEQQITCSVGVASTKFVAKLASTRCKPDGLAVVPADGVLEYLHPLPVGALWGVGDRTGEQLDKLGLRTVGDLAALPLAVLRRSVGEAQAAHLHALAWGRDPRRVVVGTPDKSIGAEETFDVDVADSDLINRELLRLSEKTAARLRSTGQVGRTVVIKVRFGDFSTVNRSRTLQSPTDGTQEIYDTARRLYVGLSPTMPIRLVGVRVEGIGPAAAVARQPTLDEPDRGWTEADRAVDAVARRFGSGAIRPAALVRPNVRTAPNVDEVRARGERRSQKGPNKGSTEGNGQL